MQPVLHVQLLSPGNVFVQFAFMEHPPLFVVHGSNSVEHKSFTIRQGICIGKVNRVNFEFTEENFNDKFSKEPQTHLCKMSHYPYNQLCRNKLEELLNLLRYSWKNNVALQTVMNVLIMCLIFYVFHTYLALTSQTPPQASSTTAEIEKSL